MHPLLHWLLVWSYLGGLIPAAIIASAVIKVGPKARMRRFGLPLAAGPSLWTVFLVAAIVGMIMWTIHRMRRGRPLVPPPTALPRDPGRG